MFYLCFQTPFDVRWTFLLKFDSFSLVGSASVCLNAQCDECVIQMSRVCHSIIIYAWQWLFCVLDMSLSLPLALRVPLLSCQRMCVCAMCVFAFVCARNCFSFLKKKLWINCWHLINKSRVIPSCYTGLVSRWKLQLRIPSCISPFKCVRVRTIYSNGLTEERKNAFLMQPCIRCACYAYVLKQQTPARDHSQVRYSKWVSRLYWTWSEK